MSEAFDCMGGRARGDARALAGHVRRASPHQGPWPRVQVWQGSSDPLVVPSNADAIVLQWAHLHGVGPKPDRTDLVGAYPRRAWLGADGAPAIEQYSITGMGHGVPLGGAGAVGEAGAHMLDVGLSSTARIAAFFEIAPDEAEPAQATAPALAAPTARPGPAAGRPEAAGGVQQVIEDALRRAGLMR